MLDSYKKKKHESFAITTKVKVDKEMLDKIAEDITFIKRTITCNEI